jgi:hypothetical protein
MKNTIRLTESDLVNLIKKIVNEQENRGSDAFEDYIYELEQIYQNAFNLNVDEMSEDDMEFAEDEISRMLNHAETNVDLSDDEMEELYDMADDMMRDMHFEFSNRYDMNEGTKAKKPKAMRSKKSGIKTQKTINQNHEILRKIIKEEMEHDNSDDPEEFTITGKIKVVPNPPSKTPHFVLVSNNKHLHGTKLIGGLYGYGNKTVKLTGVTKNGKHPSHLNPLKITKKPEEV